MTKEEVMAANVLNALIMAFSRIRSRNLFFVDERLQRCYADGDNVPFLNNYKERDSNDDSRIRELRGYVMQHFRVFEDLNAKVERSLQLRPASKTCNKCGGSRRRVFV